MQQATGQVRVVVRGVGGHYFEWIYRQGQEDLAADMVARTANDPRLPFSWGDATEVGRMIRKNQTGGE